MLRRILFLPLLAAGCATTGSTLGSGVGDALVDRPPYYAGAPSASLSGGSVGHLPIAYQRGAAQAPIFDPDLTPDLQALLREMNAYLDAKGVSRRLVEGGSVSAVSHAQTRVPPDVRLGCQTEGGAPGGECVERGDSALGRGPQYMLLAVGRPSAEWVSWIGEVMADQGVDRTLVITLEVGQYWTRQRGLRGTKEVELGTGHVQQLPWLTSLETPVTVLQLTGAVVGADGRALRIGAEGLLARRTRLLLSAVGAQELIGDEDVARLRTERRDDLPGRPLVWQAALEALLAQLAPAR